MKDSKTGSRRKKTTTTTSPCRIKETTVQAMIVTALEMAGFSVNRSPGTRNGDPDIRAYRTDGPDTVKLAIEIKRDEKAKVGLWQVRKLMRLIKSGYHADVVFGYKDFERKFGRYL